MTHNHESPDASTLPAVEFTEDNTAPRRPR